MKKSTFKKLIKHFTLKEIAAVWSNIEDIDMWIMIYLDTLRKELNTPIKITSLTKGIHIKNSYHYQGRAVDFKVLGRIPKHKVVQKMLDVGFAGIGVYYGNVYHGDIRKSTALWKRVRGVYQPLF